MNFLSDEGLLERDLNFFKSDRFSEFPDVLEIVFSCSPRFSNYTGSPDRYKLILRSMTLKILQCFLFKKQEIGMTRTRIAFRVVATYL